MSNELTEPEKAACRKASEYYAALADGKEIEFIGHHEPMSSDPVRFDAGDVIRQKCDFRILSPPKMRPLTPEELPELLGAKIRRNTTGMLFIATDCADLSPRGLFENCTYYEGPHAGLPVGKVCDE